MRPGIEDGFARSCYAAPDRIVVATALTDLEYLVPDAIAHAEAARAELVFVHAIVPGEPPAKATYYNPLKADRDARLTLEVLSRHIRARNIACSVAVRHGSPVEVLEEFLRERATGRLMIGTRANAEGNANELGSTAAQLLLQTPIPVCAVPPQIRQDVKSKIPVQNAKSEEKPRKILYPVGEQGPNPEGVRYALDLAQYFRAELILLQISGGGSVSAASSSISCSAGLWPSMRRMTHPDGSVPALLGAAQEAGASLLLVEAPPSLAGSAATPATLAELVARATCPVLAFPVLPMDHKHPDLRVLPGFHSNTSAASSVGVH
ncbi:MAG: universal stress protein [Acidobacteriaceae bacterium]